ncbi:TPA: hypothetical protein ACXHW4_004732 [Enterobacter hormaechei]
MKQVIFAMLLSVISATAIAQTTCTQDPSGNIQCTGFDDNGVMIQSTTIQTPNGNYETNGVYGNDSFNSSRYTTPGGSVIFN